MMRPSRLLALLVGIGTLVGVFSFARRYFEKVAEGRSPSVWPILVDEFTAAWFAVLLIFVEGKAADITPPQVPEGREWHVAFSTDDSVSGTVENELAVPADTVAVLELTTLES